MVICEARLPDGTWKEVLDLAQRQPRPPYLIVTFSLADDRLWAEVLNLGTVAQPGAAASAATKLRRLIECHIE